MTKGSSSAVVAPNTSIDTVKTNAQNGAYDLFLTGGTSNADPVIFEQASKAQISPSIGETDGTKIVLGFDSDLNALFNYSNLSFSFRVGNEDQPVLQGYESGVQDFEVKKKLYGPLNYGGTPTQEQSTAQIGAGFSDVRDGVDYSSWMTNPPTQHDSYPYKHIVRRAEVTSCFPTVSINSLFDTIHAGDNVGVQQAATLRLQIEYGFEGAVGVKYTQLIAAATNEVGALLSGGNKLPQIALKQFTTTVDKSYTSLITNAYLNSINTIGDLPTNAQLKNVRASADDIPGLTADHLSDFGYTSGELLFPGDTWKDVNRYVKITKTDSETRSTLMRRDVDISYFTEIIALPFKYPFSASCGTTFDARSFYRQPTRQWDLRGKKILVPSNYNVLDGEGSDKRFVQSSENYGKRDIYKFNGSNNYFKSTKDILLGERNFEIKVKVKFGSIITNSDFQYVIDTDGGTTTANRITVHQTNGNITIFGRESDGSAIGGSNFDISSYSASHLFEVSIKRKGSKLFFNVTANGTALTEQTHTLSNGLNLNFDVSAGRALMIGINANEGTSTVLDANGKVADLKVYRDGQIINWYDGTIINTQRLGNVMKDKVGGSHADLIGTYNTVETDSTFFFGKNKEIIYNGEWDGSFKLAWSDNPAWILYDLMINPVYGIGNNLDDRDDINIFRLYDLGRYCDAVDSDGLFDGVSDSTFGLEPRFSLNIRLHNPKNAFEVLGNIASVFRAISYWDGAALNFQVDRPKPVSAIFNNENVFDGIFNYGDITSSARYTRVEVPYADHKDQFTVKFEYVEDEERIRQYGLLVNKVNGIGCTSRSQARRVGKYVLLSNKFETELVSFRAGPEAMFLEPGDVFQIQDDVKNFEISYGTVEQILTGTDGSSNLTGAFVIGKDINTGSIELGSNGGIYTYNNKKQNPLKELNDIVKLNREEQFGADLNTFTGMVPFETITGAQDTTQISKFYVNSIIGVADHGYKLSLDSTQANFSDITGVHTGATFNIELSNREPKLFKLVKVSEEENNLYSIHGMQYSLGKFDLTEADDFDQDENTYNIGIPNNVINRPSAPTVVSQAFINNLRQVSITGEITKAAGSNETKYRIIAYMEERPSAYYQKEVLAETDGVTSFRIDGISDTAGGTINLRAIALRNPDSIGGESSTNKLKVSKNPLVWSNSLFKEISTSQNNEFTRLNETGYGTGVSLSSNCEYNFTAVDTRNYNINFVEGDEHFINVYMKNGDDYNLIKQNHQENTYTLSEATNRINNNGQLSTGVELKFELCTGENVVIDTTFYKTIIT